MKITVTAREILDRGVDVWDKFCDKHGYSPWCMKDGLMSSDEEFSLSKEEAIEYGFIKKENY